MTIAARIKHLEKQHQILGKKIDRLESSGAFQNELVNKLKKQRLHILDDLVKIKETIAFNTSKQNE